MNRHGDGAQAAGGDKLYWDASFAIARGLMREHPGADLENVSLMQVFEWVIQLPDFVDDPDMANDELLAAIYQDWYEETIPYGE